ncbi:MAG: hydroxymethylglutaryl-CoA reductase [Kiritimatiellae bacterium]|jgi:hydroxymethylglutaryl-CoA reductase (NADPH)|nr:hydroxymethylglutaryl-CoA reductase [Kiritimatiellia bacterium]
MKKRDEVETAALPMRKVGPVQVTGSEGAMEVRVPLATFETPLWPSVERGARVTAHAGGICATVFDEGMTRSVLVEAPDAPAALDLVRFVKAQRRALEDRAAGTSRFARLKEVHIEVVGRLVWIRFAFDTGDAAGHNMTTRAADALLAWILEQRPECAYGSVSGNLCCDKKASAVNGLLGRGKRVVAETRIPRRLVERFLHTTPEKIAELNVRKNWMGTVLAGGVRSANAHFANMLLAFYLATGQDAANIVEGSQGFTMAEAEGEELVFSVTLPNLIVGTVGNGKGLPFVEENLRGLGCLEPREPGANARRLAVICAAAVLCGELSLLAAQTNPGELMAAHLTLERGG